jgi:hypothetical protein
MLNMYSFKSHFYMCIAVYNRPVARIFQEGGEWW